ncbi:MAG: hypothetical protein D6794_11490 [Deltaproteobacteria bacterium]|nr:MAG: hypothetical protein D6794_11490 [Deltaproteobacteria bacterium]
MQQAPFQVNARSLAFDLGQTFNPLATGFGLDFKVTPAPNGYVCLSLALPEGMTRSFVALLQSLYGLMQVVDAKTRAAHAQARALDVHQIAADQQHQRTFSELCCALFDQQRDHGATINEAIRAVNRALKDQRHPWATYDTVKEELRRNGRLSSKPKARRKRGKDGS